MRFPVRKLEIMFWKSMLPLPSYSYILFLRFSVVTFESGCVHMIYIHFCLAFCCLLLIEPRGLRTMKSSDWKSKRNVFFLPRYLQGKDAVHDVRESLQAELDVTFVSNVSFDFLGFWNEHLASQVVFWGQTPGILSLKEFWFFLGGYIFLLLVPVGRCGWLLLTFCVLFCGFPGFFGAFGCFWWL